MWKVDEGLLAKTLLYMAAYRGGDVLVRELLKHTAKDQVDYVIDKLPDPRLIERFNKKFPDTKLIYLHRNPFAVVNSILRKTGESLVPGVNWGPRVDGAHEGMNHEILSANLYSQCLRWLREAQLKSVSIHEVFYEDFVVDPETVYQGVFDFLDVEVSPGTRRSINQMFDEFPLRKARLDAWRTELTPDVKAEVARELETECALLPERYLVSLETFNADASK